MAKKKTSGSKSRPIDKRAKAGRSWLASKMVLMHKREVASWKAFFVIAFFAGAASMLIWAVDMNIQTSSQAGSDKSEKKTEHKIVKGELLIRFKDGVSKDNQDKALKEHGAKVKDEIEKIKVKVISVPEKNQEKIKEALSNNPHVEFVEDNGMAEAFAVPNDPSVGSQWHFSKIAAQQGWDVSMGNSSPITICDSGVDADHPDLVTKLLPGYNYYDNNNNTDDVQGHGTAVAGTAAAVTNNAVGVAGLAWNNPIIPVRISDPTAWATYSAMAKCVIYGVDHGSRIINISYGGTSSTSTVQSAAEYAWGKNALVFASAGNYSTNSPIYPAATPKVVGVISTDSADNKSSFSSYGTWADIAAPGSSIYTTSRGGGYGGHSGTSFSSPMTAGLGALILAVNPSLTSQGLFDVLTKSTDDLGTTGFDEKFGYGRINVSKALQLAKSYVPAPDTTAPVVSVTTPSQGAQLSGTTSIAASASDDREVTKVEIYKNGTLFATDTSSPYSFAWDTTKDANGTYTLQAKAYDSTGNVGTSSQISVTVNNVAVSTFSILSSSASTTVNSITVSWSTSEASKGTISYGKTKTSLTSSATESVEGTIHKTIISGLEPGVAYYYQINAQTLDGVKTVQSGVASARTKRK